MRTGIVVAVVAVVAVLALIALHTRHAGEAPPSSQAGEGLLIVVTFPNLKYDVEQLVCSGDSVVSIVPLGVDPHQFQLTPEALRLIKRADLVISTGHAPFEVRIRDIVKPEKLVEIPKVPGIHLLTNPDTGKPNYHMPIYDPGNYRAFIDYVALKLGQLRPSCKTVYEEKRANLIAELEKLLAEAPRLNATAVGSAPPVQYAVEWLGLRVALLLAPEHNVPPTSRTIKEAEKLLREGAVAVVMVHGGEPVTPADSKLSQMAKDAEAPVLSVPPPYAPGSVLEKLRAIVEEARGIAGR